MYGHPAVFEVSTAGAPDTKWGESAVAFVACKPGMPMTLDELQAFERERLAHYELPRELRLVEVLPCDSNGKALKADLRERCSTRRPSPGRCISRGVRAGILLP